MAEHAVRRPVTARRRANRWLVVSVPVVLLLQPWALINRPAVAAPPFCHGPSQQSPTTRGCLPTPAECATGKYNGEWTARSEDGSILGTAECAGGPDENGERRIDRYVGGTPQPVCGTSAYDDRLTGLAWQDPNWCLVAAGDPNAGDPKARAMMTGVRYRDPVTGTRGVVTSPSPQASQVGIDMLTDGGNAMDAAVATALAVGVARPDSCGIGGGGNLVARTAADGKAYALDFQRSGPAALKKDTYSSADLRSQTGHKMVGVPGMVAGMDAALRRLGTRTLAEALQGAIELAETKGVEVSDELATNIHHNSGRLKTFEASEKAFLRWDRKPDSIRERIPYPPGSILHQPDLAASLRAIADEGPAAFYRANGVPDDGTGDVADLIVAEMKDTAGLLTADDLRSYTPLWRKPLRGSYHRHDILTMPPPTWGFVVQEVLNIIEAREDLDLRTIPHSTANWAHVLTEAHKIALADGYAWIGDPDFSTVPIEELTGKRYARLRAQEIELGTAKNFGPGTFGGQPSKATARGESSHTAHISVIDTAGNAVALTCSLGPPFGSAVVPAGAGFVLHSIGNFSLYDPAHPNDDDPNLAGPGKRPATAHAPTMVVRDGRAVLVLGAVGGDFIPMGVVNVIVNAIDYRLDGGYPAHVARAVDAARVQADPVPVENEGRSLLIEDGRIADEVIAGLRAKGHTVRGAPGLSRADRNYSATGAYVQVAGDLGTTRLAVTESRYLGSLDGGPMTQP